MKRKITLTITKIRRSISSHLALDPDAVYTDKDVQADVRETADSLGFFESENLMPAKLIPMAGDRVAHPKDEL